MSFKLTSDFIFGLLNEAASGNPEPLMETVDPEVQWRIGSETKDDVAKTGIFVQLYEVSRVRLHGLEANEGQLLEPRELGGAGFRTFAI